MISAYLHIDNLAIHYIKAGNGKKLLLAFHGYGSDGSLFTPFFPLLEKAYTILAIDLPYCGKTVWEEAVLCSQQILKNIIEQLLEKHAADHFSLLGYSIGGRVCLCIMEMMAAKIDGCFLMASDGLVFNPFYSFVTKNYIGKSVFQRFLNNEKNIKWIDYLYAGKFINEKKRRFLLHYLKTHQDRVLLQKIWFALSPLIPEYKQLKICVEQYSIKIKIFMGKKDMVIPYHHAYKFKKKLPAAEVHILDKGHYLLDKESVSLIAKKLSHP